MTIPLISPRLKKDGTPCKPVGRPAGATAAKMLERGTSRAAVVALKLSGDIPPPSEPGRPVGVRLRPEHQEEVRAKIQSSNLVTRLQKHANGEIEMSPTQIKAAEILLSKSLSSLSSMEVNTISNNDKMTEAEIMAKIADMIRADPRLTSMVVPGQAREIEDAVQVVDPLPPGTFVQGVPCVVCGDIGQPGGCVMCGADPADVSDSPD